MNRDRLHIIFVHKGNQEYLKYILNQTQKENPRVIIDLIGDESNDRYEFINHFFLEEYFSGAKEFAKKYIHLSTNKYEYELFCIQRWFIIRDFVLKNNIEKFVYLDSDVLIYVNLEEEAEKFKNFDIAITTETCPSFWNSSDSIVKFCDFVSNIYSKEDAIYYQKLINFSENYKKKSKLGGVCDLTLFSLYKNSNNTNIGETNKFADDWVYDDNFSSEKVGPFEFKKKYGVKKIIWIKNIPFGILKNGRKIRFKCLHLQGRTKVYAEQIFLHKEIPFNFLYFLKRIGVGWMYHRIKLIYAKQF